MRMRLKLRPTRVVRVAGQANQTTARVNRTKWFKKKKKGFFLLPTLNHYVNGCASSIWCQKVRVGRSGVYRHWRTFDTKIIVWCNARGVTIFVTQTKSWYAPGVLNTCWDDLSNCGDERALGQFKQFQQHSFQK